MHFPRRVGLPALPNRINNPLYAVWHRSVSPTLRVPSRAPLADRYKSKIHAMLRYIGQVAQLANIQMLVSLLLGCATYHYIALKVIS